MAEGPTGTRNTNDISRNEAVPTQPLPIDGDPSLRYERNRLDTFRNFPEVVHVLPQDLASSGFFLTGAVVKCVFCGGILSEDWETGDNPHIEHKNKFPRCPFALGIDCGNVPMTLAQPAQQMKIPNMGRSDYGSDAMRLASFKTWPQCKRQTPQQLAEAGFFYTGFGDNVKCFYCDGGLQNWEPGEEPWEEHARWFPHCSFVHTVKGDQFIRSIQERFNPTQSTSGNVNIIKIGGTKLEEAEYNQYGSDGVQNQHGSDVAQNQHGSGASQNQHGSVAEQNQHDGSGVSQNQHGSVAEQNQHRSEAEQNQHDGSDVAQNQQGSVAEQNQHGSDAEQNPHGSEGGEHLLKQKLNSIDTKVQQLKDWVLEKKHLTKEEKIKTLKELQHEIGLAKSACENERVRRRSAVESFLSNLSEFEAKIKAMK